MYPHRIRLRGPWQCEPMACSDPGRPLPPSCRMTLPCRWAEGGLTDFAGRAVFRRRFGYPGRIDDTERVWLTCAGLEGKATVSLNGRLLGQPSDPSQGFEYDITALLQPRNEVVINIDGPATGGLWGEVAMEIRRTAFLRGVQFELSAGRLIVEGLVIGTADRPLELYVLVGRSTVAYGTIAPSAEGARFTLTSEPLALQGPQRVQVDLVDGATVWYTLNQVLDLPAPQ